jgi:hypothetical protein
MTSLLLTALTLAAAVSEHWMSETEMVSAFGGRTLNGKYASGLSFTETYRPDGHISYWDPNIIATGRWRVSEQGFCTFYDDMNGGCFLARKVGANCFEFFIIETQDNGPLPPGSSKPYVAQGWYPDKPSTCSALTT